MENSILFENLSQSSLMFNDLGILNRNRFSTGKEKRSANRIDIAKASVEELTKMVVDEMMILVERDLARLRKN